MEKILECVPNFSEGRSTAVIDQLASSISSVPEARVLHIDPGEDAHRTVITFAGPPEAVVEAAYTVIARAAERIDMRQHRGVHPRMGATDVCPLVPVRGISREEAVALSHQLGRRVGESLGIPVYLYEWSATRPERKNLAHIRRGEYEGFREKILLPDWAPDYGPQRFNARAGQTVIGARDFLVAYNLNLDTADTAVARKIAREVRESGYTAVIDGQSRRIPGTCRGLKAIGWYMEHYGFSQVSTNVTDIRQTPVHLAFEAVRTTAAKYQVTVTGSELIGMIPLHCLLEAGTFFSQQKGLPVHDEAEKVALAVDCLGLSQIHPFDPLKQVIEYRLGL